MYALIHTDSLLNHNEYVKVFDTYEEACKEMRRDFFMHVVEDDSDLSDGNCWIEGDHAYDTTDASGNEWVVKEVEDCTKSDEGRPYGSAMTWRQFIAELQKHEEMLDTDALLYVDCNADFQIGEPLPFAGVIDRYPEEPTHPDNNLVAYLWGRE